MPVRIDADPGSAPLFRPAALATPQEFARAWRLPPEEATRYMAARDRVRVSYDWRELWHDEHARAFTVSRLARADLLQGLRDGLQASVAGDLSRRDWTRSARELLSQAGWWGERQVRTPDGRIVTTTFDSARLRLIYDVNTRMAYAAGRWERIQAAKATHPYLRYVTRADERVRASHRPWHGVTLPVDDPWWRTHYPPNGWRCFPGDTPVRASARLGQRLRYAGQMVELHTALGHRLTLTINHPVLTGRGWVAAGKVQAGDQVLAAAGDVDAALSGVVDDPQPPVRADDLFETLAAQGLSVVPVAPDDFDGDARCGESEVHIAGADSVLMDEWQAALDEGRGHGRLDTALHRAVEAAGVAGSPALAGAVMREAVLAQDAADLRLAQAHALGDAGLAGQARAVERDDAALGLVVAGIGRGPGAGEQAGGLAALLDADPAAAHGGATAAQLDTAAQQQPAQGVSAHAGLLRELLERNPGQVALDEVVSVREFEWSGHVYDFTTTTGLMVAGGLVVSNCRCRAVPMRRSEYERRDDLVKRAPADELVDWVDTRSGIVHQVPSAVDPGFGYNVGEAHARWQGLIDAGRQKVAGYAADIGAGSADALNGLAARDWAQWLPAAQAGRAGRRLGWLGVVADSDLAHLHAAGIKPLTAEVMVRPGLVAGPKARRHEAARDALSDTDWQQLPQAWARGAQALLLDVRTGKLLWLLRGQAGRPAQLAMEVDFVQQRPKRTTNAVRSAYRVDSADLRGRIAGGQMRLLWGSVE
jgi:SPP1 gp7 family putative phage head morphogenesis protein